MVEAQNKIVSIASFRARGSADRSTGARHPEPAAALSQRSIEHRERMLRFLRMEAAERAQRACQFEPHDAPGSKAVQARLLL
jgi:hypothetical protein